MINHIVIFDYRITATNPVGGCHLRILRNLCHKYRFTVFAVQFENPSPESIEWIRIPAPVRPYAALFVTFHLLAPIYYLRWRLTQKESRVDLIQFVESNLSFGDVSYVQFCHRHYLRHYWRRSKSSGLRGRIQWLGHWLPSQAEAFVLKKAQTCVVPSTGTAQDLTQEYPEIRDRIRVLPNPVDVDRMRRPESFDRSGFRGSLGFADKDVVLAFVAQGHFERKGLPLLFDAFQGVPSEFLKLLVIGGIPGTISLYKQESLKRSLGSRVVFAGMQSDIRPWLWASDGFAFPSYYETFSLASFEAAASGLPVIASRLNGVEEFLCDGVNGLIVERDVGHLTAALDRFLKMTGAERNLMGLRARESVARFATPAFVEAWDLLYQSSLSTADRRRRRTRNPDEDMLATWRLAADGYRKAADAEADPDIRQTLVERAQEIELHVEALAHSAQQ